MRTPIQLVSVLALSSAMLLAGCGASPNAVAAQRSAASSNAQAAKKPVKQAVVKQVSVQEAAALLAKNPQIVLLDVRTPEEFAGGRAKGAINHPLGDIDQWLPTLDKKKAYAVICHSGRRSQVAAGTMVDKGFGDVTNIQGGTATWADAGLPMEK